MNQPAPVATCTVAEQLDIDESKLEEWSEINDYWSRAYDFYEQVKDEHIDDISVGRMAWLRKIERSLQDDDPEQWD